MRRYLVAPVTILLGQEDAGTDGLSVTPDPMAQGAKRFARGESVFRQAGAIARQRGWPFNWRMVIVPGVGHSARSMLSADQAVAAVRP